jgi:hypothetical protein
MRAAMKSSGQSQRPVVFHFSMNKDCAAGHAKASLNIWELGCFGDRFAGSERFFFTSPKNDGIGQKASSIDKKHRFQAINVAIRQ